MTLLHAARHTGIALQHSHLSRNASSSVGAYLLPTGTTAEAAAGVAAAASFETGNVFCGSANFFCRDALLSCATLLPKDAARLYLTWS